MMNAKLSSFAKELSIDRFRQKKLCHNLKILEANVRKEKKKIRVSTGTGSVWRNAYTKSRDVFRSKCIS